MRSTRTSGHATRSISPPVDLPREAAGVPSAGRGCARPRNDGAPGVASRPDPRAGAERAAERRAASSAGRNARPYLGGSRRGHRRGRARRLVARFLRRSGRGERHARRARRPERPRARDRGRRGESRRDADAVPRSSCGAWHRRRAARITRSGSSRTASRNAGPVRAARRRDALAAGCARADDRGLLEPDGGVDADRRPALHRCLVVVRASAAFYTRRLTRAQTEVSKFFDISIDMLCVLRVRRLPQARQSGVPAHAWLHGAGAALPAIRELRPPDDREASAADLGTLSSGIGTGIYEAAPAPRRLYRWLHWTAVLGRRRVELLRPRPRRHRPQARGGAAGVVTGADRRGGGHCSQANRARPPRRRTAAAGLALDRPPSRGGASARRPEAAARLLASAQEGWRSRSPSFAIWRGAFIRRSSTTRTVAALESLVAGSLVPVSLTIATREQFPETIERAAYFVVSRRSRMSASTRAPRM